jgi:hypothetical protein
MTADSGLILTAHIDEGVYQCVGYDYTGKKIVGPVTVDSPLRPSTGWQFLYTGNNVIFGSTPKIFDTDGTLLTEFHVRRGDLWQMYPLADAAVLLQDSNAVRVISVPTMIVLKEYWLPELGRYDYFETSVSPDETAYAVSGDDRIVILDLVTGSIAAVPMEFHESVPTTPHFCLSPRGSSLLLQDYSGNVVSIYRLIGGKYARTAGSPDAARPPGGGFGYGLPCFIGNYCVLNYFVTTPDGVLHSSVVFDYVTANGERYPALSIPGIASAAVSDSADQLVVLHSVGPVSAGANATISRVQLQGVSYEK